MRALGGGDWHRLAYRRRLWLPDVCAPATIDHLTATAGFGLAPPWPRVAVAAGRRAAPVLRWLKRAAGDAVFTVYLMRPARLAGIDLAVIPQHDAPPDDPRIITTTGALHPFNRTALDAVDDALPAGVSAMPRPHVTVLIGGPARGVRFDARDLDALAAAVDELVGKLGGSVLATTSRRTPPGFADRLAARLMAPRCVHDAGSTAPNPLRAMLAAADRVVVTGESASMMSEACATGRPVHLWPMTGTPAKLRRLAAALEAQGSVRPWTDLTADRVAPLDEAARVAGLVLERLAA